MPAHPDSLIPLQQQQSQQQPQPQPPPTDAPASAAATPATVCERCGAGFRCGVQDPTPCPCTSVQLDAAQRGALRQRYQHCLCVRCLAAIAGGASPDRQC